MILSSRSQKTVVYGLFIGAHRGNGFLFLCPRPAIGVDEDERAIMDYLTPLPCGRSGLCLRLCA